MIHLAFQLCCNSRIVYVLTLLHFPDHSRPCYTFSTLKDIFDSNELWRKSYWHVRFLVSSSNTLKMLQVVFVCQDENEIEMQKFVQRNKIKSQVQKIP